MKKIIIGLIVMISPLISIGHNPLSAKYYLEVSPHAAVLNINLSQVGVNQVLYKKYGKEAINKMDQKQFKELIVAYIKDHFHLSADKEKVELKEGGIKLGSHQTDLKFVLPPFPKDLSELGLLIPAFQENDNHQTIFYYKLNGRKGKVILRANNAYRSNIDFSKTTRAAKVSKHSTSYRLPLLLLLLISVLVYRLRQKPSLISS